MNPHFSQGQNSGMLLTSKGSNLRNVTNILGGQTSGMTGSDQIGTGGSDVPEYTLTGAIHKWLGKNNPYHGKPALFSFSILNGGQSIENKGLRFPDGARWFISAFDPGFIKTLIQGIQRDPSIMEGMSVNEIMIQEDPAFGDARVFRVGSPVLVKHRTSEERIHHCLFSETIADGLLTETLRNKLANANLPVDGVRVEFIRNHPGARAKVIHYDNIGNRANFCPVGIYGSPEQLAFAWNVGIGHSTGIGFGSLV